MICKFCNGETDQATVFGVLERTHFDNRRATTDTDTGEISYAAKALVKVPYCMACAKTVQHDIKKKYIRASLGFFVAALVFTAIRFLIGTNSSESDRTLVNGCTFIGAITLIGAIANLIMVLKSAAKQSGTLEEHCIEKYTEARSIPATDVIAPVQGESVMLTPSEGNLSNRWSIKYDPVSSKHLESAKFTKSSSGRKTH